MGLRVSDIEKGIVEITEGPAQLFEGADMNGPSLKLTVNDRVFFWSDQATMDDSAIIRVRAELLKQWVAQRQSVRVYSFRDDIVAIEPAT